MGPGPRTCCHNILRWELFGGTNLMHGGSRKADDLLGDCRRGATRHSPSIPELQTNNRQSFLCSQTCSAGCDVLPPSLPLEDVRGQEDGQDHLGAAREDLQLGAQQGRRGAPHQLPLGDQGHAQCLCFQVGFELKKYFLLLTMIVKLNIT